MKNRLTLLCVLLLGSLTLPATEPVPQAANTAVFNKLKVLVGSWEGIMTEDGKTMPATTRYELITGSSVLAMWLAEGKPMEMLTMIHPDGKDLLATHYCAAHNQPRMVYVPGDDPNRFVFKFRDGTNIGPEGHMQQLTLILDGPDHHIQEWTYLQGDGKESAPGRFDFRRKP